MNKINTLYRKYRPNKFKEVISQDHIKSTIIESIHSNKLHHAYIFYGIRGTGKTTLAKILAKAINCLNFKDDVCLECENCKKFNENQIDILEIDAASNNGVEEIRNIIESIQYSSHIFNNRVFIIDEVHMLTNSAWNALLKTIEEPPKNVYFIFATTEYNKIPLTILSRCQSFKVNKLNQLELCELINNVTKLEKIKISKDSVDKIAKLSYGSARDCLTILEQISIFSHNDITKEKVNKLFGFISNDKIILFLNNIFLNTNINNVFEDLNYFYLNLDSNVLVDNVISILIDWKIWILTNDKNLLDVIEHEELNLINKNIELSKIDNLLNELYLLNISNQNNDYKFNNFKAIITKTINSNTNISANQIIENNTKEINNKKESINQIDLKKLFKTKEVSLNTNKNNNSIITNKQEKNNDLNIKDIFTKIAYYNNKNNITKINEKLRNIRNSEYYDEILKTLTYSNRFYLNYDNIYILLFENKNDSDRFNKLFVKDENNKSILSKELDCNDISIIAIDMKSAAEYNKYAKNLNKSEISKLNYEELNNYFKEFREKQIKEEILKII